MKSQIIVMVVLVDASHTSNDGPSSKTIHPWQQLNSVPSSHPCSLFLEPLLVYWISVFAISMDLSQSGLSFYLSLLASKLVHLPWWQIQSSGKYRSVRADPVESIKTGR